MTMVPTLGWPTIAVLGFLLLTGLVVALATTSTARYEFELNGTRERQRSEARSHGTHPAGRRSGGGPAGAADTQAQPRTVDLAVRQVPAPTTGGPGWWLVDEWAQVVAGPFADRVDADWAALAEGLPAVSVHGIPSADGGVSPRPSPEERAWFAELSDQLDRLPSDWDDLVDDTDPLTTLVVEIAAALVEAGLPLQDVSQGRSAGGVCMMPDWPSRGVRVSWRPHDRMGRHAVRGPAAHAMVEQQMNVAIGDVLANLGFVVEPLGATGGSLVTALR